MGWCWYVDICRASGCDVAWWWSSSSPCSRIFPHPCPVMQIPPHLAVDGCMHASLHVCLWYGLTAPSLQTYAHMCCCRMDKEWWSLMFPWRCLIAVVGASVTTVLHCMVGHDHIYLYLNTYAHMLLVGHDHIYLYLICIYMYVWYGITCVIDGFHLGWS